MKNFHNYSEMPVKMDKKPNVWFPGTIKKLNLSIKNDFVVELTKKNADIVKAHFDNNQSYNLEFTKKIFEYHCFADGKETIKVSKKAILDLIVMVDYENSTNIWRYREKRDYIHAMVDYIVNPENKFWKRLEDGDVNLVDDLNPEKNKASGPKSLCSKVCEYFCEMFFNKDNYYINDFVVRHVLPYYLDYYLILY